MPKFYNGLFDDIYKMEAWDSTFSTVESCARYMEFIEIFIRQNKIKKVLEVGTGDWGFSAEIDWQDVVYHGIDVSRMAAYKNKRDYDSENIEFFNTDIFGLPNLDYDLVIIKDVLQHLNNAEIELMLNELLYTAKIKHFIITNDQVPNVNKDLKVQGLAKRGVDITAKPFPYKAMSIKLIEGKITQYR